MHTEPHVSSGELLRSFGTRAFALTETRHRRGTVLARHAHAHACVNFVLAGLYDEGVPTLEREHAPLGMVFKPAEGEHDNRFSRAGARCLLVELLDAELAPPEVGLGAPRASRDPRAAAACLRLWSALADAPEPLEIEALATEVYALTLGAPEREGGSPRVRTARTLLEESPGARWTLSSLAAQVGLHPSHLGRAFRARHGTSLGEYQRQLRVNEAARRLAREDVPLAELATELGFADQSHLTRAFRRRLGRTPAAFRRLHRDG